MYRRRLLAASLSQRPGSRSCIVPVRSNPALVFCGHFDRWVAAVDFQLFARFLLLDLVGQCARRSVRSVACSLPHPLTCQFIARIDGSFPGRQGDLAYLLGLGSNDHGLQLCRNKQRPMGFNDDSHTLLWL